LDGVLADMGMASFSDVLSKSDVADIHAYIESVGGAAKKSAPHRLH
jgi:mono/diheme cytochrome c family protein